MNTTAVNVNEVFHSSTPHPSSPDLLPCSSQGLVDVTPPAALTDGKAIYQETWGTGTPETPFSATKERQEKLKV